MTDATASNPMTNKTPESDEYNYHDEHWRCGRNNECGLPAGWGTDHTGVGACKLHGGKGGRPIEHGIYSDVVRPEDQALLDALEDISTAKKLDETLNLQVMKLRRAVAMTENPDAEQDFWGMFETLVESAASEEELNPALVSELAGMLQTPGRAQRDLMDLIRRTAKTLHDITEGQDLNVNHGVDDDAIDELKELASEAYE